MINLDFVGQYGVMLKWICILVVALCPLLADDAADYQGWHDKCLATDDEKVIDSYIAKFQAKFDADPSDQLAKVYLGSVYTLRSAASSWGPKKLEYLKKGGRMMDEAAGADWHNPRVRFLRATNGYKVPKRFKRRPVAIEDFTYLLPIGIKGGHGLSRRERQAMLYYAWRTFDEEGHKEKAAQAKWHCHQLDPASWYGKEAGS